jgi:hypothetical protein
VQVKLAERLRLATDSEKRFATFQQVWTGVATGVAAGAATGVATGVATGGRGVAVLLAFDLPLQAFAEVIRVDLNFCEVLYVCYMCAICVGAHDVGAQGRAHDV